MVLLLKLENEGPASRSGAFKGMPARVRRVRSGMDRSDRTVCLARPQASRRAFDCDRSTAGVNVLRVRRTAA
jgi:hypothetical protein